MSEGCRQCGRRTAWVRHYDEDGPYDEPAEYCDLCLDVMAERAAKRREWDYYHPDEACPDVELPPLPATLRPAEKEKGEQMSTGE